MAIDGSISILIESNGNVGVTASVTDDDFVIANEPDAYRFIWHEGNNVLGGFEQPTGGPYSLGTVGDQTVPENKIIFITVKVLTRRGNLGFFIYRNIGNGASFSTFIAPDSQVILNSKKWLIPVLSNVMR